MKNFIANLVPAQPVCGKNRNEIFRKRGGGGSKAVRKFSGNSFDSGETGFPYFSMLLKKVDQTELHGCLGAKRNAGN